LEARSLLVRGARRQNQPLGGRPQADDGLGDPNNNPFGNGQREESSGHGTQKPVECMRRPIANNSRSGQAIYDPFLGSGTSLIAAEMSGRVCYGLELDPAYVDVVVRRWQRFTGREATHQASGDAFDERARSQECDRGGRDHG
jgi:DNA modification methylase